MNTRLLEKSIFIGLIAILAFTYIVGLLFFSFDLNKFTRNNTSINNTLELVRNSETKFFSLPDAFAKLMSNEDVSKETIKQSVDPLTELINNGEKMILYAERAQESVFIKFFPVFQQKMTITIENYKATVDQNRSELAYYEEFLKDNPNRNDLLLLAGKVIKDRNRAAESLSKFNNSQLFYGNKSILLSNKNVIVGIIAAILCGVILIVVSTIQAINTRKKIKLTIFWVTISVLTIFSITFFLVSLRL